MTKLCHKCGSTKALAEFSLSSRTTDGRQSSCKNCVSIAWSSKREEHRQKRQIYTSTHKEEMARWDKEYRESPASYKRFGTKLTTEESAREGANGELLVKCTFCKEYFSPSTTAVRERVRCISGRGIGESRLYCCEEHKSLCDIHWAKSIPKSSRSTAIMARCSQGSMKKAILSSQVNEVGYAYCEKCGSSPKTLDLHHTIPVASNYGEANNSAHQLLLCKPCHLSLHRGC